METIYNKKISMIVKNLSSDKRTCDVVYREGSRVKTLQAVRITSLLLWRFENREDHVLDKKYTSVVNSPVKADMPFQLIAYGTEDDIRYLLDCVEVAKSDKVERVDVFGKIYADYYNKYYTKQQYRRFRDRVVRK